VQLSREFLHVIFNVSWVLQLGVLVLLAILLRRKPDLLHQQADTVRSQFQGQDKLPTLVWAYGQVSCHNSQQLFACLLKGEQMTHMDLFVTEPNFQRNVLMGIITYVVVNIEP
jgi:hypothetical protein